MPWLKAGDNAATYPPLMNVLVDAQLRGEPWLVNELAGFIHRCAEQSAGHMTDSRIDLGTAAMLSGGRHDLLLRLAVTHGLMTVSGRGRARRWELIQDDEFLHIRKRDEIEWERQRKRDNSNPDLVVPVRARDGDACRYCNNVVSWSNRKGDRGGTYDHVNGEAATSPEQLVVCCFKCNSARGGGADLKLLPVPAQPLLQPVTVRLLEKHNYPIPSTARLVGRDTANSATPQSQRPGAQPDTATSWDTAAPSDPAPGWATPPATSTDDPPRDNAASASDPEVAASAVPALAVQEGDVDAQKLGEASRRSARASPPDLCSAGDGSARYLPDQADTGRYEVSGPGRVGDGSGLVGAGLAGSGRGGAGAPPGPSGRRRGRRGKGKI